MSASREAEASGAEAPVRYCAAVNEPSHSRAELPLRAPCHVVQDAVDALARPGRALLVALYFSVADSARR